MAFFSYTGTVIDGRETPIKLRNNHHESRSASSIYCTCRWLPFICLLCTHLLNYYYLDVY